MTPDNDRSVDQLRLLAEQAGGDVRDLAAQALRYRDALGELLEEAVDMRSYVPEYFAKKWSHDDALDAARRVLDA